MDRIVICIGLAFYAAASLLAACSSPGAARSAPTQPPTTPRPAPTVTAAPAVAAATPVPPASPRATSVAIQRDVTYCSPDGVPQQMDLFRPSRQGERPTPAVIYLHGGAWMEGDKSGDAWLTPLLQRLVAEGYLVAAVNYRLAPQHKWPAQIEDAKCAVRYLRANASVLNLNPNAIAAWGLSAGGHLAALLGTTDPGAGLEGSSGYPEQSSRVQAVVDIAGPADLVLPGFSISQHDIARDVFGATSAQDEVLQRASPVSYVSRDDPPFLIVQGDKDTVVPPRQSQTLHDRLKAAGVDSTLMMIRNGDHSLSSVGSETSPSRDEVTTAVLAFLNLHLRRRAGT